MSQSISVHTHTHAHKKKWQIRDCRIKYDDDHEMNEWMKEWKTQTQIEKKNFISI